ncbi:MAG: sulfatase [Candidatus Bathyarchaeia archaeon]
MNLVCVCLDTFRADLVGKDEKLGFVDTPNLDEFASNSIVFDEAFGECQPTLQMRRAFFTGKRSFPWRYNFDRRGHWHHAAGWHKIPPDQDTLAEILLSQGYMTGFISDTYHMFKPTMNYTRGFVTYDFIRGQESDNWKGGNIGELEKKLEKYVDHSRAKILYAGLIQYLLNIQDRKSEEDYFCAQVFSRSAEWLEENQGNQPFFLWVDSFDPHEPWDPPVEYADRYCPNYDGKDYIFGRPPIDASEKVLERMKALYYGEVTLVDKWFGRFMEKLDDLGLRDDTIIIVLSDHGTQLLDHGRFGKGMEEMHPFNTRIVWYLYHPNEPHGRHVRSLVQGHDVMPTILDLLHVPIENLDGESVWPLVIGEKEEIRNHAVVAWAGWSSGPAIGRVSVRDSEWNYVCTIGKVDPKTELYHLPSDPEEKENTVSEHTEVAPKQRRRIESVLGQPLPGSMIELCDPSVSPFHEYLLRKNRTTVEQVYELFKESQRERNARK